MTAMTTEEPAAPHDPHAGQLRFARRAGILVMGLALGLSLLPAIFELLSLAGNVTPFKYQNF